MNDKPTYREYRKCSQGEFVKTEGGQYYKVEAGKTVKNTAKLLSLIIAGIYFCADILLIIFQDRVWQNLQMDILVFAVLLEYGIYRLAYRFNRFIQIEEGIHDYYVASSLVYKKRFYHNRIWTLLVMVPILFALLNSFSITYIRSRIEHNSAVSRVEIIQYDGLKETEISIIDGQGILLSARLKDVSVYISITRTPDAVQFYLDGQPVDEQFRHLGIAWFWEKGFFPQKYELYFSKEEIHNGSVLEMACGDLYRKWVFDLTGEDAA